MGEGPERGTSPPMKNCEGEDRGHATVEKVLNEI